MPDLKELAVNAKAWPFDEAKKLLKRFDAVLWEDVTINSRGLVRDSILGAGVTVPGECCGQIITRSGEVPIVSERTRSA